MEACRRNCSCERPELPFTITKELNSFAVVKEYMVKLDEGYVCASVSKLSATALAHVLCSTGCCLRHNGFVSTTQYSCSGHLWTPYLQSLLDDR